jgi:hypothetical protein
VRAQSDFTEIQTFIDSNITRKFLSTNLKNDILSANLASKLNYNGSEGKINYYLKNYYSSSITKLGQSLFRDFDNVKTGLGYGFSDKFSAYVNYYGMLFSDDKSIQFKGASSNAFTLSGIYENSFDAVSVNSNLYAGYKIERQIGELNRGMTLSGEFNVENLNLTGFFVNGDLRLGYDDLKPRKNDLVIANLSFEKSLSEGLARNEFDGTFSRIRKDFYFPADQTTQTQFNITNNIDKRTETVVKAFDRFDYTISNKVNFYVTLNPYYRDITKVSFYIPILTTTSPSIYDAELQESSINGDAALRFDLDKLNYQFKVSYDERDEKHYLINPERIAANFVKQTTDLESSKNNHSGTFKLSSNLYYSLSEKNRLELSGSASIFRYYTPSENNTDDRDELNYLLYLGHTYDNHNNFQLINTVDLNLYHTVYIFSEKSSNNNWNRILRFTSSNIFKPVKNLKTTNTFSVLANYTVYDFEDIISSVKSYSFRQFNFKDSTVYDFSKYFGTDLYTELKLYERGELNWREFSIRPVNFYEDRIINAELNYFLNKYITLSGGYRYFEQLRYNYVNGAKVFDTYVRTQGPQAKLRVYMNDNSLVEVISSYDYYSYGNQIPNASNGNLYVNVVWNF